MDSNNNNPIHTVFLIIVCALMTFFLGLAVGIDYQKKAVVKGVIDLNRVSKPQQFQVTLKVEVADGKVKTLKPLSAR